MERRTRDIQLKLTKGMYEKDKEAYERLVTQQKALDEKLKLER